MSAHGILSQTRLGRLPLALLALLVGLLAVGACTPSFFGATAWSGVVPAADSLALYYGSVFGGVVALDPAGEKSLWRFPPLGDTKIAPVYSTPALGHGLLYFGDYSGRVYAVTETGTRRWDYQTQGRILGSAVVAGSGVYIGSADGSLYAFNATEGNLLWTFPTSGPIWGTPAVAGSVVYLPSMDKNLYAVDAGTGKELWRFPTGGPVAGTPVVEDRIVYVGSFDKKLYALGAQDGRERWSFPSDNWFWTQPLLQKGILYAGGLDHNLYALESATGREMWRFPTQGALRTGPLAIEGGVTVGAEDGVVYAVNPQGTELWSHKVETPIYAPLALAGDVILVAGQNGLVYGLDSKRGRGLWSFDSRAKEE